MAFPRSRLEGLAPIAGARRAIRPDSVYELWYASPPDAAEGDFVGTVVGRAQWASFGIQHHLEIDEPGPGLLDSLLAPGEACPFLIEITAQDMASFLIHPDGTATDRVSAPIELSRVRLADEGTDFYRISGTATNGNAFKVKNVTVSGVLLDASGQIVSMGSAYVLQEDIAPGASVRFDVRVDKAAYAQYQLYAQAEQDWD